MPVPARPASQTLPVNARQAGPSTQSRPHRSQCGEWALRRRTRTADRQNRCEAYPSGEGHAEGDAEFIGMTRLPFGEAGAGGVATVGNAAERILDWQLFDGVRIVTVEPFLRFGMVWMLGVGGRVERRVEARGAAAILGRPVPLAGGVARVGEAGISGADAGNSEPMLPAIAEVVEIVDRGLARPEHVAEADLAGVEARLGSPVLVHRQSVFALGDGELPEMEVEPPHRGLNDVVQDLKRHRCRHLDLAPDHRVSVLELDADGSNFVKAVGGGVHAASLAAPRFQFQGRSSASLAAGWSLIRAEDVGERRLRIDVVELGRSQ